jgi:ABC-type multidrug transport system fused ATPase/permease subunit
MASYISSEMLRVRYIKVQEKISAINARPGREHHRGAGRQGVRARERAVGPFVDRNRQNLDANMATAMVQAISGPLIQFVGVASTALMLWVGAIA